MYIYISIVVKEDWKMNSPNIIKDNLIKKIRFDVYTCYKNKTQITAS